MQTHLFDAAEPCSSLRTVSVALPVPLPKTFDYLVPANIGSLPVPGTRVQVPFHGRELTGLVIDVKSDRDIHPGQLKQIIRVIDDTPLIPESLLELLQWTADYYSHPVGDIVATALPTLIAKGHPPEIQTLEYWQALKPDIPTTIKKAPRQEELLELIVQHPEGVSSTIIREMGFSRSVIRALEDKKLVHAFKVDQINALNTQKSPTEQPYALSEHQSAAAQFLKNQSGAFSTTLLQGVTGSGKTEVYLELIRHLIQSGQQCLVLVPEINLTPQTLRRFQKGLQATIGVLHSGLSDAERCSTWQLARLGRVDVVIGTRSAIFTPFAQLGAIIVDEEHDASFKQQEGFRYSARDLAVKRAYIEQCMTVLGSATPSLESLLNTSTGKYHLQHLPHRAGNAKPPAIELLDIQSRPLTQGLSRPLISAIQEHLSSGQQVMIFQNRRGYAPTLICQDCSWIAMCSHCDARLTLHTRPTRLLCHHCDARQSLPAYCPSCQSSKLHPLGTGTTQIEEVCQQLFPDAPIIRIDRDSTRKKNAMNDKMQTILTGQPCILVGTQMLAKGHDFPGITLVAVLDADSGLFSANYRAEEHTAQMLIQVAGRAGRGDKPGQVIIQTTQGNHPLMQLIRKADYHAISRYLLAQREAASLPPFRPASKIIANSTNENLLLSTLANVKESVRTLFSQSYDSDYLLAGPFPSSLARKANHYYQEIHIFFPDKVRAKQWNARISDLLRGAIPGKVQWAYDVDPAQ